MVTVPTSRQMQARPGVRATTRRRRWIKARGGRRPLGATVTGLHQVCTVSAQTRAPLPRPPRVARMPALHPPVPGPVVRPFSYSEARPFVAGAHRGVDFAGLPGAVVRAACAGRVAWARGSVVVLRCGGFRVAVLPLAALSVRTGERIRPHERLGTLGRSPGHAGLHLGVRREGERFGYVDPESLLARRHGPPPPPVAGPGPRRTVRPTPAVPPVAPVRAAPAPGPAAVRILAPWPAWAGLAVFVLGAGGGTNVTLRRRRAAVVRSELARG